MNNPNALRQERAELFANADKATRNAIATGRDLAGGELETFNKQVARMREIDSLLKHGEQLMTLELPDTPPMFPGFNLNGAKHTNPNRENCHSAVLREAFKHATPGQRAEVESLAAYLSGNVYAATDLKPSGDGGYIIPAFVREVMERNFTQFAPVVSVARLFPTETGADTTFPVLSDSESAAQVDAAALTGADATVSGDTPPTDITGPKLGAYKVSSKPVFIPRETITDSPIDIIQEVLGALLARVIRFENLKYTAGAGTGEAEGFTHACSTMHAGAVALDLDIALDLAYAVPALYRPNGVFQMSDTTAKYLRKLKTGLSGDKRQLWADADATKGTPPTLHGYPVVINNDMDSVAPDGTFAAKSPLAFGDFKRFVVRQAEYSAPYIYRYSVPARDGSAVVLFRRSDSKLLVPEAICKLIV
jgi:HK97 family phage major capsid protein